MTHLSIASAFDAMSAANAAYEAFMVGGTIMFLVWFCLKGES